MIFHNSEADSLYLKNYLNPLKKKNCDKKSGEERMDLGIGYDHRCTQGGEEGEGGYKCTLPPKFLQNLLLKMQKNTKTVYPPNEIFAPISLPSQNLAKTS